MQKKSLLLSLIFGIILFSASAGTVDLKKAKTAGVNFYYEMINRAGHVSYSSLRVDETFTGTADGQTAYYILNLKDGGWIVVSATDNVTPVLAYSFEGSYSPENQPPQFTEWMKGYANQIALAMTEGTTASTAVAAQWEHLSTNDPATLVTDRSVRDVAPFLISTWDQGNPYNFLCPEDAGGPGGHVWSGCVATAMSQVMYYYRWPETGAGDHCYYPSGYPEQCADFANTTYKWADMLNSATFKDTAMALLQWHAGIAVDMMYGAGGSGAYSDDAAAALRTNFKYNTNTTLVYKSDYSESQWAQLLMDNLDARRPLYYHGFGSGGHAFNVDGYQGTDYFHFNWGWSGSYNGYFYLNNLNPGGSNFTEGQGAIINIYPDTTNYSYPVYCGSQGSLTSLSGTFEDGSGPAKNYQANANCSWLIEPSTPSDSITSITITFNRFDTEAENDVVNIYQGAIIDNSMLVATYSGTTIPPSVTVPGNKALVTFNTNGSVESGGWYVSYHATPVNWCAGTTILTNPEGSFADGSLDFNYQNNTVCKYKLIPEGGGAMTLHFTSFNTEEGADVVKIYDLVNENLIGEFSGSYTGDNLPSVTAPGGQMFIIFTTNSGVTKPGWEAEYTTYPVAVEENTPFQGFTLYPNPAKESVTATFHYLADGKGSIELMNLNGSLLLSREVAVQKGINKITVSLPDMGSGVYTLRLTTDSQTIVRKLIINRINY